MIRSCMATKMAAPAGKVECRAATRSPGFVVQLEQALHTGRCRRSRPKPRWLYTRGVITVTVATSPTPTLIPIPTAPPPVSAAPPPQTALTIDIQSGCGGDGVTIAVKVERPSSQRRVYERNVKLKHWKLTLRSVFWNQKSRDYCSSRFPWVRVSEVMPIESHRRPVREVLCSLLRCLFDHRPRVVDEPCITDLRAGVGYIAHAKGRDLIFLCE